MRCSEAAVKGTSFCNIRNTVEIIIISSALCILVVVLQKKLLLCDRYMYCIYL